KELESQVTSLAKREEDAADIKSKAMSLLKYAEKTAETKGREVNDRMAEQQALLEAQQKELGKVTRAREDLEQREHRFDTAKAEFEARAKAVEQREKRLKTQGDALERERAESKTMLKQLEVEGERVSQKEAAVEALVAPAAWKTSDRPTEPANRKRGGRGRRSQTTGRK